MHPDLRVKVPKKCKSNKSKEQQLQLAGSNIDESSTRHVPPGACPPAFHTASSAPVSPPTSPLSPSSGWERTSTPTASPEVSAQRLHVVLQRESPDTGMGLTIEFVKDGVLVKGIDTGGIAEGRLQARDVILKINGASVSSMEELRDAIAGQLELRLTVRRDVPTSRPGSPMTATETSEEASLRLVAQMQAEEGRGAGGTPPADDEAASLALAMQLQAEEDAAASGMAPPQQAMDRQDQVDVGQITVYGQDLSETDHRDTEGQKLLVRRHTREASRRLEPAPRTLAPSHPAARRACARRCRSRCPSRRCSGAAAANARAPPRVARAASACSTTASRPSRLSAAEWHARTSASPGAASPTAGARAAAAARAHAGPAGSPMQNQAEKHQAITRVTKGFGTFSF
jgi:hypothetical protein